MTVLLRGATGVRDEIASYLASAVPVTVAFARSQWGLDNNQLPMPVAYDAYEPYALDKWPLVGINVAQSNRFTTMGYHEDWSPRYMPEYTVRVFTWVRTPMDEDGMPLEPEYSQSIRLRDDLAACVRATILGSGCLGQPGRILFDESSMSEEYSETTKVKGDRFVAGVVHSFTIRHDETIPITAIGTVNILDLDATYMNNAFTAAEFTASLVVN